MRTTDGPHRVDGADTPTATLMRWSRVLMVGVTVACALALLLAMARGELPAAEPDPTPRGALPAPVAYH